MSDEIAIKIERDNAIKRALKAETERDKARAKALEVDGWKQEAEINDGWVKKISEALRNGSTEFVKNERADELEKERDDWKKRWAVENENLDKASTEVARLMGEVERWKAAMKVYHAIRFKLSNAVWREDDFKAAKAYGKQLWDANEAMRDGDLEALEKALGVKP